MNRPLVIQPPALLSYGILPSSGAASPTAPGTGYVPGEIITLTGGAFSRAGKVSLYSTQVISAAVVSGGSGGSNGAVTITGTTGTGTKFQATGTIAAGALTGALTVTVVGDYTTNPTSLSAEPVTGGSLSGATVSLAMGVGAYSVVDVGSYTGIPASPVAQGSTSGAGTGATFTFSWGTLAAAIDWASLAFGKGNLFIGGNANNRSGELLPGELAGSQCSGAECTYVGDRAGSRATTGSFNTALGHNAFGNGAGAAVTGSNNAAVGCDALRNPTSAANDVAVGANALKNCSSGSGNSAIGFNAFAAATTASDNTGVGQLAGQNITGGQNVIVGSKAAGGGTGGSATNNTIVGYNAANAITTGATNTIIGKDVGSATLTTGARNILIGTSSAVDTPASGTNDHLNIGGLIFGDVSANKYLMIGSVTAAVAWLGIAAGTTAKAQINLAVSAAPSAPVDGDIWLESNTNTGLKMRINGVTKTVTVS